MEVLRILAVGDVYGSTGLDFLKKRLWKIRDQMGIDLCVVNGENTALVGITPEQAWDLFDAGADVVTLGKGFGNGFPVTCMAVRTPYADAVDKISASTSYGGNPMACAAALACFEVIEEEGLLEHAQELEVLFKNRMKDWTEKYQIVGDTRCKGCLLGIELVKDKKLKTPFDEAGKMVYQKAFSKGLAWVPAGHILRMSPPIIMPNEVAMKGMDIIEEAIAETEKELLG